jgi:hypothetical protein
VAAAVGGHDRLAHFRHEVVTDVSHLLRYVGQTDNKEVPMFDNLTRELLDLSADVRGARSAAFALVFDCCSCTCCGCLFNCG